MTRTLLLVGVGLALLGGAVTLLAARRIGRLQTELSHQAFHDTLTGLANRALFTDRVGHALARAERVGTSTAVLFIDLDDFKAVNDSLGHAAGDALLVTVADRLRLCLRPGDTAARLGGDEFAVLLEDLPGPDVAAAVADRVLSCLRPPVTLAGRQITVCGSVGVASDQADVETLLAAADAAMYAAKAAGKGQHQTFHAGLRDQATHRLQLQADLQRALHADEFVLHYQPTVALHSGTITGAEALVRWQHPHRGLLPPGEFIPIAEETGLIVPLGRWVLREACRQAAAWRSAHPLDTFVITVNVSSVQLRHPDCTAAVAGALADSGLDPAHLVLELTETALLADDGVDRLQELKALGIQLAIDDFGTGYSSLAYLRHLPIDLLKLDRSFIDGMEHGGERRALVRGILDLGHALGLDVLAEGIESAAQRHELTELGCVLGQGYHFSRPVPPHAVDELLRHGTHLGQETLVSVAG